MQREADVRVGALLSSLLDQAARAEVDALLARGEVTQAVRRVRELTGLRLIDAKRLVDSLRASLLRRRRHGAGGGGRSSPDESEIGCAMPSRSHDDQ